MNLFDMKSAIHATHSQIVAMALVFNGLSSLAPLRNAEPNDD